MRTSTIVMIGFAVLFGLLAVFVAQSWLNTQTELRMKNMEAKAPTPVSTQTVVVAARSLAFGSDLSAPLALKEIPWPEGAVPAGVFAKISDLTAGGKRMVLTPIEQNEPVLASKITGPGQRATLSALLHPGMRAVTVRVNDVDGVGGFALPGDRVDVTLTRQIDKGAGSTDVVLKNIRVLAVDQMADDRAEKPQVGRSVTLEVETVAAQKLALAASVGTLSLLLRKAGDASDETTRRVTFTDLFGGVATPQQDTRFATVAVTRGAKKDDVSVPVEGAGKRELSTVGQR